ncbi:MAG: histidinol-phosphatase HisJ family protein, partial [Clostridia bacterium]|nr:histidinol-phosphatase HisJ family protein [Clostridia bacterium]
FCDGRTAPEDMVKAAIEKGFGALGFSGHSYTSIDLTYCMTQPKLDEYELAIKALKQKYAGKIDIYYGLEKDYYTDPDNHHYDYTIGSVHYICKDGVYRSVDHTAELAKETIEQFYGGDVYGYCRDYFANAADVANKTDCDIVGHFDVVRKFNINGCMLDENDPRYRNAALEAAQALLEQNVIFELNTSGAQPGRSGQMYPADFILKEIHSKGGRVILSSDCHNCDLLDFGFDEAREKLASIGFDNVTVIKNGKFVQEKI